MTGARPAILLVLLAQLATSFADMAVPVLAPVITESAGLAPETVGYFSSLMAIGTLFFLVLGGDATRWVGAGRLLLWGTLLSGAALSLVASGVWPFLMLAALVLGLSYGPNVPAATELLASTVPERWRSLAFSIKQAGVPAAGALAGLSLPFLALTWGWQAAVLAASAGIALSGVLLAGLLSHLPPVAKAARPFHLRGILSWRRLGSPVASLGLAPSLPGLAYSGTVLAAVQSSVVAFLVTYLVDDQDVSLPVAGSIFVVFQLIGIPGRILAGYLADRIGSARRGLVILAGLSGAAIMLLPASDPAWPVAAWYAVVAMLGLVIGGWNGLILAEVAQVAKPEDAGPATAAIGFYSFVGFVLGPSIFAVAVSEIGYDASFWILAAAGLTPVVALGWRLESR